MISVLCSKLEITVICAYVRVYGILKIGTYLKNYCVDSVKNYQSKNIKSKRGIIYHTDY